MMLGGGGCWAYDIWLQIHTINLVMDGVGWSVVTMIQEHRFVLTRLDING